MTVTAKGVNSSTVDYSDWSILWNDATNANGPMSVPSGLAVTVSGSSVVVAAGRSYQAGTNVYSDAPVTLAVPTNTGTQPRIDIVAVQVDNPLDEGSAGSIIIVPGTPAASPVPPALRQVPGNRWRTPLAQYTLAAGKATPTALIDLRPLPGGQVAKGDATVAIPSSGVVTVTHNLGVKPTWASAFNTNRNTVTQPIWETRTATTIGFEIRRLLDNSIVNTGSTEIVWKVEG